MEKYIERLKELKDEANTNPHISLDIRMLIDEIDDEIQQYERAIIVTQSALDNSFTLKDLHTGALQNYRKKLTSFIELKKDLAALAAAKAS